VLAGLIAAAVSILGVLDQPTWKLVVASSLCGVLGFVVAAATDATAPDERVPWLIATSCTLAVLLIFTYWQLRRPASQAPIALYTVDGTEVQELLPSGEPGGSQLRLGTTPLYGGSTYEFECQTVVTDSADRVWLRLVGSRYWYPLALLHPPEGVRIRDLPPC